MDWNLWLDEGALTRLLPAAHARFAKPVKEGLALFLEGLPAAVQRRLVEQQRDLGPQASLPLRLGRLARLSPVLQKLGQVLARDQRLAPALRQELSRLEWLPPTASREAVEAMLRREIGPLEPLGVRLDEPPLAEGSVAVVIPFVGLGGAPRRGERVPRRGVFKLLKPGIERRLQRELELLSRVGSRLDARCAELTLPPLDYRETFDQVADLLRHEVCLTREQRHLEEAAEVYAGDPRVVAPQLLEPCSPRVTAMERIDGVKLDAAAIPSGDERRRLARVALEAVVAQPLFSAADCALFHGDPHAGNLFRAADGRLALLDWSLAGRLSADLRAATAQLALAAVIRQPRRIEDVLGGLARGTAWDRDGLRRAVAKALQDLPPSVLPGFAWLVGLLDAAVQGGRLRLPSELVLFRKTLLTVTGVAADLSGDADCADAVLAGQFLRQFAVEWPLRWRCTPWSRDWPTRLSNADLWEAAAGMMGLWGRFWWEAASRWLAAKSPRSVGSA